VVIYYYQGADFDRARQRLVLALPPANVINSSVSSATRLRHFSLQ